MQIEHIFLDMDGVLTNFVAAVLRVHGRDELLSQWTPGERDIPKLLGISRGEYWRKIDSFGAEFWSSLEPYPWFNELIDIARGVAPLTILTSPSLSPSSLKGKVCWLYEHFPKVRGRRFTNYLIGPEKHLLAQPNRVLIDDSEANVDAFRMAGGQAILFPQFWNRNHNFTEPIEYVRQQLYGSSFES